MQAVASQAEKVLRWGILGCSWIAPMAMINPCKSLKNAEIYAIAARDVNKARVYAKKHSIPVVHDSYDALLADDNIDAIYNPLPNSLHKKWTIAALQAGKHVLLEKPFASNAEDAREIIKVSEDTGFLVIEAFHYRFHPFAKRIKEKVDHLAALRSVDIEFCIKIFSNDDIRFNWDLAGGACMDTGSYTLNMLRFLVEPRYTIECISAKAKTKPNFHKEIDVDMEANFELIGANDEKCSARTRCSLDKLIPSTSVNIVGSDGTRISVTNYICPQYYHSMDVYAPDGTRTHHERQFFGEQPGTYACQLRVATESFLANKYLGVPWEPQDSIRTMELIDSVYLASGLSLRQS